MDQNLLDENGNFLLKQFAYQLIESVDKLNKKVDQEREYRVKAEKEMFEYKQAIDRRLTQLEIKDKYDSKISNRVTTAVISIVVSVVTAFVVSLLK